MNAAFCCASLAIVRTVRHADYTGASFDVLREDNRAAVRAASQASKAADWLLSHLPEESEADPIAEWTAASWRRLPSVPPESEQQGAAA